MSATHARSRAAGVEIGSLFGPDRRLANDAMWLRNTPPEPRTAAGKVLHGNHSVELGPPFRRRSPMLVLPTSALPLSAPDSGLLGGGAWLFTGDRGHAMQEQVF